ncbi:prephenate dehydratase [Oceaniglobus roseus]|uniref:prephenate dehydratase n=1 Tax=Oceaniglobus roseus TaxID=1737570 RepID=UPI000C7EF0A4|nr:prephenate dehydratase [Kandeliimicrobium roseum]
MPGKISFQGELGAYSHQACVQSRPDHLPLPCTTFEDALEAVRSGEADLGMIAVENSTYGRVADVHSLLPNSGLKIVDEAFVRVHICLLGVPGATLDQVKTAMSHTVLLGQCKKFLKSHAIRPVTGADTAGSAALVAQRGDAAAAALASELAGQIYGLETLAKNIEDNSNNTTRFLVMAREADLSRRGDGAMVTSFVFRVRNIPAALYKAMGGFATNGINMTKLESYMVNGEFTATQFYADVEGHPDDENMKLAFDELAHFTSELTVLGTYPRRL